MGRGRDYLMETLHLRLLCVCVCVCVKREKKRRNRSEKGSFNVRNFYKYA